MNDTLQSLIKKKAKEYKSDVIELRRHLHKNPELSFQEINTSLYIQEQLTKLNIEFKSGVVKTGIVALIKGISKVAQKLNISVDHGEGYRALTNLSENGGQEVPHLHFHLFGGEKIGKMVE